MDPRYRDMRVHRVSMLGSALRRGSHLGRLKQPDPEHSRDPRVLSLVEVLKSVDYAPAPSPDFRAELRAQLVAVAPRIISESTPAEAEPAAAGPVPVAPGARSHHRRFTRPVALTLGVAAAFLLLFGGAVWQSQKSLPGDSLYGLKRASENVQLALSSGQTDRGDEYLSLAQTRVEEARALLRRDSASAAGAGTLAGGLSKSTATLIETNLASADSDLRNGTRLLDTQAVTSKTQSPISLITSWAPGQLDRLHDLADALPQGPLQNRTTTSWTLTKSALTRARTLSPAVASGCASTDDSDRLGPVPTCAASPSTTGTSGTPGTARTPSSPLTSTAPSSAPSVGKTTTHSSPDAPGASAPGASVSRSSTTGITARPISSPAARTSTSPPVIRLPSAPVSIGSCGVSVSLGPIGIGVGGCPSHS